MDLVICASQGVRWFCPGQEGWWRRFGRGAWIETAQRWLFRLAGAGSDDWLCIRLEARRQASTGIRGGMEADGRQQFGLAVASNIARPKCVPSSYSTLIPARLARSSHPTPQYSTPPPEVRHRETSQLLHPHLSRHSRRPIRQDGSL
jgi:hypothetical protein